MVTRSRLNSGGCLSWIILFVMGVSAVSFLLDKQYGVVDAVSWIPFLLYCGGVFDPPRSNRSRSWLLVRRGSLKESNQSVKAIDGWRTSWKMECSHFRIVPGAFSHSSIHVGLDTCSALVAWLIKMVGRMYLYSTHIKYIHRLHRHKYGYKQLISKITQRVWGIFLAMGYPRHFLFKN